MCVLVPPYLYAYVESVNHDSSAQEKETEEIVWQKPTVSGDMQKVHES